MVGSLKGLLMDVTQKLSWQTRLTFAHDVASGMNYLHSKDAVHRGDFNAKSRVPWEHLSAGSLLLLSSHTIV